MSLFVTRRALFAAGLVAAGCRKPAPPAVPSPPAAVPLWSYEVPAVGGFVAAPCVAADGVYLAAYHARGFRLTGAVYALVPDTGRLKWRFDAGGAMLPSVSAPLLAGGRLFVGEGMHANFVCHVYALDPATGRMLWKFRTADHVESGPVWAAGRVVFGAGNDGVFAIDADAGTEVWHYDNDIHVDSTPCVVGDKVVFGTGPSRRFRATKVVALDARTGRRRWETAVNLPAWGGVAAAGGRVFVGLGNGRLTEPARPPDTPAGAVACLNADTGDVVWRADTADAVFQRPTPHADAVYFSSRDGFAYCVAADSGNVRFRVPLGGPAVSAPAVEGDAAYFATVPGRRVKLNRVAGEILAERDLAAMTGTTPRVYAPLVRAGGREYLAGEFRLTRDDIGAAAVYCFPAADS